MKDIDIIKALECCGRLKGQDCDTCPLIELQLSECTAKVATHALDLINRQKAEIERLLNLNHRLEKALFEKEEKIQELIKEIDKAEFEAIKEFWEELKARNTMDRRIISVESGDNLVKEMTEGNGNADEN